MNKIALFTANSKILVFSLSFILALLVAYVDYITGHEVGLSIFYLIPVMLVSATIGKNAGVVIAVFAGIAWTVSKFTAGKPYPHIFVFYWNGVGRAIMLSIFAFIVAELKRVFEREKEFARRDFITEIPNAKAFSEVAGREIERLRRYKRPLTVAYIDCDNFKAVNDAFGHKAGDEFLRSAAQTIRGNIRSVDMAACLGGDEFVIILPETGYEAAQEVIGRLNTTLLNKVPTRGLPITYSIGVAIFVNPPKLVDEMIRQADRLMYQAKREGKNAVKYKIIGEQEL